MRADAHVVRHHDLVVQLDAVRHQGVVQRAAVDRGVGPDFNVGADRHSAQLGNLAPGALAQRGVRREAESVRAQHGATVDDRPRAHLHAVVQRDVRMPPASRPDRRSGADAATRPQYRIAADARTGFHDTIGADTHAFLDHRVGRDDCRRVLGGRLRRPPGGIEPLRHTRVKQIGMFADDQRERRPGSPFGFQGLGDLGGDDDRPCLRRAELALVAGVRQESDFLTACRRQGPDAADPQGVRAGGRADTPVRARGSGRATQCGRRRRAGKIQ
ncbi:hypothetical protein G6F57_018097 [Rhizopus arrhizus]|nr:hypothetical protein G6F57_018097 [Rhizopus arrhizus]